MKEVEVPEYMKEIFNIIEKDWLNPKYICNKQPIFGKFYKIPNQSLSWLFKTTANALSIYEENLDNILGVGSTFYTGILKGLFQENTNSNLNVVEINPLSAVSQIYLIYLIKKGNTLEETINDFLIEKGLKTFDIEEIKEPREHFKEFSYQCGFKDDEKIELIFNGLFGIFDYTNHFAVKGKAEDEMDGILYEIYNANMFRTPESTYSKLKPDSLGSTPNFPDNIIINNFNTTTQEIKQESVDFILSNNVVEWSNISDFYQKSNSLLKQNGLLEVTVLDFGDVFSEGFELFDNCQILEHNEIELSQNLNNKKIQERIIRILNKSNFTSNWESTKIFRKK